MRRFALGLGVIVLSLAQFASAAIQAASENSALFGHTDQNSPGINQGPVTRSATNAAHRVG